MKHKIVIRIEYIIPDGKTILIGGQEIANQIRDDMAEIDIDANVTVEQEIKE